ncbi:MetQ/NlpA family ABC transporter substrate-binding protein [Aquitalea sp. USM4]|uniref:MetQ/NlpA family ABC transporter substrate-binding protein n=1 Tax=Aquitalea sp. USM4 TaxID=1590041 RepID=UPI00103E7868|nr:MetQ/NlpA family ABC transporter substrate-binding protein [Aquitalea sp. USM4]QBJ79858.1 methionine ABC transporter substrate-binding protein [Aquitalea sp. USM4]
MKRVSKLFAALSLSVAALAVHAENVKLVVAASPVPHAEILEALKPTLAKQGVDLQVKVFNDYVLPNTQVEEKQLDANFFQHIPYLDKFNKDRGTHLVVASKPVHIEPFAAYSSKYKKVADLPQGATVAIPNDPTNAGRALLLLDQGGVIKLKDRKNIYPTTKDIVSNPKSIKIKELEAATLPRVLNQVDVALINANYALEAKLNPKKDGLFTETTSPYANLLVARPDNKNSAAIKKLAAALNSPEAKKFIETKYQGAVIPAF